VASPAAHADRGGVDNPPATSTTPKSVNGRLSSRVTYSGTGYGTGGGGHTQRITSSDQSFTPPDCWYEAFTPDEFKQILQDRYYDAGNSNSDTVYDYYYQVRSDMNDIHYHKGDDGKWWVLTYNPDLPADTAGSCTLSDGWMWVGPGDPPPPAPVTPEMLSKAAYQATQLPLRDVKLSPAANGQKVNLPTYAQFADAIPEVYVTAQVPNPPVAATVVAEPYALRIDAGTSYADPQSCEYTFKKVGDQYNVNTAGSDCNITYRKATSGGGGYTLKAQITWRVHWTASADPNGPVAGTLPTGYTTAPQDVAVQEIQTVNR
jgi:enoyl reductase